MAAPGNFTTLAASGAVTFPLGAQVGYLWQCSNAGTGACGWVAPSAVSPAGALTVSSADTNLSVSLGGTPSTALLAATSIGVNWSGLLAVTRGGTGFGSCVLGDLPYGSGSNTMAMLAANATATRKFLLSVSGGAPQWTTLTAADIASATMNFTSIGFAMAPPSNAYISTTSRAGIAGANYQVSLGGTYTGISSTTSIIDLDITTTHTSTTSTLTTSAGIQITPNTNATSATITSHYAMLINTGTNSGGTVTTAYGIYNTIQTIGTTNYGYYQGGTFTKTADVGFQLINTFSPTAAVAGQLSQINISSTYTPTSGPYTVAAFYNSYSNPTITITSASVITTTAYYGLSVKPAAISMSGAAHVITDLYNLYSASPSPTLLNSASITRAYSGYFVNPSAGTSNVALYADSLQVGGVVNTASVTGIIKSSSSIVCGNGQVLSTTTTTQNGFLYVPTMAGPPTTATPVTQTNTSAIVFDSTNNIPFVYTGVSGVPWTPFGNMVLIEKQKLVAQGAPRVPASGSFPTGFNHLKIIFIGSLPSGTTDSGFTMNAVASGYSYQYTGSTGSTMFGISNTAATSWYLPSLGSVATRPSVISITLYNYNDTTWCKSYEASGGTADGTNLRAGVIVGTSNTTAAINYITLNNTLIVGSFVYTYGVY